MSFLVDIEAQLNTFHLRVRLDSEEMKAGDVIGLLGASGSGKTMTLRYISGTATPDRGRIVVNGTTFFDSEAGVNLRPQRRRVGYLFQNYALFPNMTVLQNVECGVLGAQMQKRASAAGRERSAGRMRSGYEREGNRNRGECVRCAQQPQGPQNILRERTAAGIPAVFGKRRKQLRERAEEAIRKVHLEGMEERRPQQLSGGQQQRCALARILVGDPDIVLLDEPFSALDEYLRDEMMEETLGVLRSLGITVFFVTHSRNEARYACTDIAVIHDGTIQETGKTEEIFEHPASEWGRILTAKSLDFQDYIK